MRAPAPVLPVVHCSGAPRDLGFDQGVALASRIACEALLETPRAQPARWLCEHAPTRRARAVRRAWRDTLRHFPHMAERALGLARGSGASVFALAALLARADESARAPDAVRVFESARGLLLARVLEAGRDALALRHSAPAPGYASVEVALAWQVPALLGINAHGLALSGAPTKAGRVQFAPATQPASELPERAEDEMARAAAVAQPANAPLARAQDETTSSDAVAQPANESLARVKAAPVVRAAGALVPDGRAVQPSACAAPAVLLVQDCLQRFDTVAKALEWMARRPAAGGAEFWLADAHGARARVQLECVEGKTRAVHCEAGGAAHALPAVSDDATLGAALRAAFSCVAKPIAVAELATRRAGVLLPDAKWAWSAAPAAQARGV